jgi:hypothetical protein
MCVYVYCAHCRFDVLEASMGKVAKKAVPAEKYAAELVAVSLRPSLPR